MVGVLVGSDMRPRGLGVWGLRARLGLLWMHFVTGSDTLPQARVVALLCVMSGGV